MKNSLSSLLYFLSNIKFFIISFLGGKTVGVQAMIIKDDEILLVRHTYLAGWYTVGGEWKKKKLRLKH